MEKAEEDMAIEDNSTTEPEMPIWTNMTSYETPEMPALTHRGMSYSKNLMSTS